MSESFSSDVQRDVFPYRRPTLLEGIFAVLQAREFLEDRYYLSEQHGRNVGDLYAMDHWVESGHAVRFRTLFELRKKKIMKACASYCGNVCAVYAQRNGSGRGLSEADVSICPMPSERLHGLLEKRRF